MSLLSKVLVKKCNLPISIKLSDLAVIKVYQTSKSHQDSMLPQFNKLLINEDDRGLANHKEEVGKLPKAFPRHMIRKECEICQELVERYSLFPCGHNYFNMCITKVFKSAIGDRSLIPIKCCRVEIDQNLAEYVLETYDFNRFQESLHEVDTKKKMYW
jgi:hypothetical protein